jgi:hypothetical protein
MVLFGSSHKPHTIRALATVKIMLPEPYNQLFQ